MFTWHWLTLSLCLPVCLCGQRTLSRQEDVLSTVQLEVQQVSLGLGPGLEELEQLRKSLDAVMQEVSATEALKEHLGKKNLNICLHKPAVTESVFLSVLKIPVQVVMWLFPLARRCSLQSWVLWGLEWHFSEHFVFQELWRRVWSTTQVSWISTRLSSVGTSSTCRSSRPRPTTANWSGRSRTLGTRRRPRPEVSRLALAACRSTPGAVATKWLPRSIWMGTGKEEGLTCPFMSSWCQETLMLCCHGLSNRPSLCLFWIRAVLVITELSALDPTQHPKASNDPPPSLSATWLLDFHASFLWTSWKLPRTLRMSTMTRCLSKWKWTELV